MSRNIHLIAVRRCFHLIFKRMPQMRRFKTASRVIVLILAFKWLGIVSCALPGARYGAASWYYDNKLWIYGGIGYGDNATSSDSGYLSDLWSYDTLTNTWMFVTGDRTVNQMGNAELGFSLNNNPGGLVQMCSWLDDSTNQLWMFGGQKGAGAYSSAAWAFDPAVGQWANPTYAGSSYQILPRFIHGCASVGQSTVYISGGYNQNGYLGDLLRFNTSALNDNSSEPFTLISGNPSPNCPTMLSSYNTPSSTELPSCGSRIASWATSPTELHFMTGSVFFDLIIEEYKCTVGSPSTWELLKPGNITKRYDPASTSKDGKAWLYGGTDSNVWFAELHEYNGTAWNLLRSSSFSKVYPDQPGTGDLSTTPGARIDSAMWVDDSGDLWMFGGSYQGLMNDMWKYTMSTGIWSWMSGSKSINQYGDYPAPAPVSSPPLSPPVTPTPVGSSPAPEPTSQQPINVPIDQAEPIVFTLPTDVPSNPVNGTTPEPNQGLSTQVKIAVGVVVPVVVIGVGLLVLLLLLKKRKKQRANETTRTTLVPLGDFRPDPRYRAVNANHDTYGNLDTVGVPSLSLAEGNYGSIPATESNRLIPYTSVTLDKEIGEGSFGKVFLGKLRTTKVAIKVANTKLPQDEFIREANFQLAIPPHPNIVQLLGISIDGPQPLVILEYCNEGSLDRILFKTNKLQTISDQIGLAEAIARGIDHLHQNNIVHRDLAVRNILLHHGEPKISDFGMSRKLKEVSQVGKTATTIGPLRWMAPEALGKQLYSTKSDVWSFGMILYEIVAHEEPHEYEDLINVAIKIREQGYAPPIPENCPQVLREVMEQCWKMDPEERPDMGTICEMLEQEPDSE